MLVKNVFRGVDFAHHFHASGAVKEALNRKIPCFILYRKPEDAIASYYLFEYSSRITDLNKFEPDKKLLSCYLAYYISYYTYILKNRDKLVLVSFDKLINYPEKVMFCINEIVPEPQKRKASEIKTAVSKAKYRINGPTDTLSSNRPNDIKEKFKMVLFLELQKVEDFHRANELHEELRKVISNI